MLPKPSICTCKLQQLSTDMLALGVFAEDLTRDDGVLKEIDRVLRGAVSLLIRREEFGQKKDQTLLFDTLGQLGFSRVLLCSLGKREELTAVDLRLFAAKAAREANGAKVRSLAVGLGGPVSPAQLRAVGEGIVLGAYRFDKYMTGSRKPKTSITNATVWLVGETKKPKPEAARELALGARIASCVCIARDLVNEPANELTPAQLAACAQRVAREHKLACEVFDKKEIIRRGMKLVMAVGQGSANEPRVIHMTYRPARASKKRLVLVGKGLTFDSGGLCIKPAQGMEEMKSDMAGAANVVAFMAAVAILRPNIEVHGVIGAAENMPDGGAYRPGDIFGSLDGKTVEIVNTDAEGRLVLADCLAFGKSLNPTVMVCNATLTGACVVALGQHCTGFFASNDSLAEAITKAAAAAGEQFWRLPMAPDLKEKLNSDVADLKHCGDRWGGSITAALFLSEFVGDVPFVHCDIAGPSLADKPFAFYTKGGTGHGVLTFVEFLATM